MPPARTKAAYERVAPDPAGFNAMMAAIETMIATEPDYSAQDLARIHGPAVAIVDGDHEELIKPEHTLYLARTIPRVPDHSDGRQPLRPLQRPWSEP